MLMLLAIVGSVANRLAGVVLESSLTFILFNDMLLFACVATAITVAIERRIAISAITFAATAFAIVLFPPHAVATFSVGIVLGLLFIAVSLWSRARVTGA